MLADIEPFSSHRANRMRASPVSSSRDRRKCTGNSEHNHFESWPDVPAKQMASMGGAVAFAHDNVHMQTGSAIGLPLLFLLPSQRKCGILLLVAKTSSPWRQIP
jgi:hypothetical protein